MLLRMISVPRRPSSTTRVGATSRSPTPAWAAGEASKSAGAISASWANERNNMRDMGFLRNGQEEDGPKMVIIRLTIARNHGSKKMGAADSSAAPCPKHPAGRVLHLCEDQ